MEIISGDTPSLEKNMRPDMQTGPSIAAVRAEFPQLERLAYFQTGTFGMMAECVLRQVLELIVLFERRSWEVHSEMLAKVEEARRHLAARIGARPEELAFTRNATDGVNLVAAGIAWQPGDEIVISDQEHPAMNYPWRWAMQRTGAVVRRFHVEHDPAATLQNVAALITPRTQLIGTSWVTSPYGIRLPVREICALARQHGILSLVDGAQAFGVFPIDVRELGCDFFTSNGHKWLGGPKGTGFFWARADLLPQLQPAHVGAGSAERFSFEDGLFLHPTGRRFEFGTDDHALHAGLGPALAWFDRLGWDWIEARTRQLSAYLKQELSGVPGVRVKTPFEWERACGLTSFEVPGADERRLWEYLRDEWRVLPRTLAPHQLRVSTAYFNTEEEVDRLVAGVRAFLAR